jgi:hypothetical protein
MRRIVCFLLYALLLGAGLSLAGCVVVPARGPARVWVPGYWVQPHVWVEGHWRYR